MRKYQLFRLLIATTFALALVLDSNCAAPVIYPRPTADIDLAVSYPVELLRLALNHADPQRTLAPTDFALPQSRAVRMLQQGGQLSVIWTVTSPERERQLLAVPVPIDRGLYGWRLLLIAPGTQKLFDDISALPQLAKLQGGQGHDWPDLTILRSAGLNVYGAPNYDGLFDMLARGRIDFYPRALPEIWPELGQRSALGLVLEDNLVLHYPSAVFFFVAKNDAQLAGTLQRGLEAAFADGSFQTLFSQQFGAAIEDAKLGARTQFRLANPLLPDLTKRVAPHWWFDPQQNLTRAAQITEPNAGQN
jgi:hypothetical protein